jgi:hypothetical protein
MYASGWATALRTVKNLHKSMKTMHRTKKNARRKHSLAQEVLKPVQRLLDSAITSLKRCSALISRADATGHERCCDTVAHMYRAIKNTDG